MSEEIMAANPAAPITPAEGPATPTEPAQPTPAAEPAKETAPADVTQTKAFSERLKEMSAKAASAAVDAEYARLYEADYGIKSKADYDAYIAKQQEEQERNTFKEANGIDPTVIDERALAALEKHPLLQTVREQQNKLVRDNAALELAKIAPQLGISEEIKSWADVEKLPKFGQIRDNVMAGNDIVAAAKLAYFEDVVTGATSKAQQETINRLNANTQSSPGSLSSSDQGEPFFTLEQINAMSQEEVKKNYKAVMASMKKHMKQT